MNIIKGLFLVIVGACILAGGFSIGIAWLGICFGTVIIGILVLVFCPTVLFLPFSVSFTFGVGLVTAGILCMKD